MTIALVSSGGTWPPAGPFPFEVLEDDGDVARLFEPHCAEVTLVSKAGANDRERYVVAVGFPTLDQARRAGRILADAIAAVHAIRGETPPAVRECTHRFHVTMFSRELKRTAVCELCGAVAEPVPRAAAGG